MIKRESWTSSSQCEELWGEDADAGRGRGDVAPSVAGLWDETDCGGAWLQPQHGEALHRGARLEFISTAGPIPGAGAYWTGRLAEVAPLAAKAI
jgi:hypothetical protein